MMVMSSFPFWVLVTLVWLLCENSFHDTLNDQYIFLNVHYTSEPQPSVPVYGAKGNQWPCLGLEELESKGRIQK